MRSSHLEAVSQDVVLAPSAHSRGLELMNLLQPNAKQKDRAAGVSELPAARSQAPAC